jgi:GDPmannose 4,6-dehydratase
VTRVLVTGATGQDAGYLIPKLAAQGYEVYGMMRAGNPERAMHLKDIPFLRLIQGDLTDYGSLVVVATQVNPDIIINTAGITSPATCWGVPELTAVTNGLGACRLLDILSNPEVRYIQFGSIAEFGPYGASKLYAERMMDDFRARGMHATTIRFAGHHSPRRSPIFFTRRVSQMVAKIKRGEQKELHLGPLDRVQDFGYAPEFMDAVMEILDMDPGTYSVGTGDPESLENFVRYAFQHVGLDFRDFVAQGDYLVQPYDVRSLSVMPDERLAWDAKTSVRQLANLMVEADLAG